MNVQDRVPILMRVLEDEQHGLEALAGGLEQALAAMCEAPLERLHAAIAALERQSEADIERAARRQAVLERLGASGMRLRELIAEIPGGAGRELRAKARALRERLDHVVALSRRLAFVVTQVLRVNAEVLSALGHPGADSDAYDRQGGRAQGAAAPGALRAEA